MKSSPFASIPLLYLAEQDHSRTGSNWLAVAEAKYLLDSANK